MKFTQEEHIAIATNELMKHPATLEKPAAAESLPMLITHTEQTSAGNNGRFYYRRLAPEEKLLKDFSL